MKRLPNTDDAVLAAVELDVLLEDPPSFEMSEDAAAPAAALFNADVSRFEMAERELNTLEELSEFTRFFEPEIKPETKLVFALSEDLSPLILDTRLTRFEIFDVFEKSSLPSALYCE